MKFSQFDTYAKYLKGAAVLIALLTYWRFRGIELSGVYSYVAQGDVVRSAIAQGPLVSRSVVWDFFGLINRLVAPHSIILLRWAGLIIALLDLYLFSRVLDRILGQKFWGFLGMFLVALSPFAVVSAVSGVAAASSAAIILLFLMALYRSQYVYAGILSGLAFGANLPGFIMLLITLLDLLQNLQERRKMIPKLLTTAAVFFGVLIPIYMYSLYAGTARFFSIPLGEHELSWQFAGILPLIAANVLNLVGIVYLIAEKRYDVYRTHFHTLMLWITMCALCFAQPSTMNLLISLAVSTILAMFFLQGFSSLWKFKLVSADTFVFVFVILFLFGDLYSNNIFLKYPVLEDSHQKSEAVDEVVESIADSLSDAGLVSNFAPAELSVRLGRKVYSVEGNILPMMSFGMPGSPIVYVARRESEVDSLSRGCRILLNTSYTEDGKDYFVQVVKCGTNK